MKTISCTIVALLASAAAATAAEPVKQDVAAIGMLPHDRGGLRIAADERNPFAVKPRDIVKVSAPENTETQESKIRSIFEDLRVTGIRRDRTGRFLALAGDLILRQGEEVKPVITEQTETLIVSKIESRQIELTFVENKDSTQPRVIILPVRNQVQVSQKLFGQPKGKSSFYIARGRTNPSDVVEAAATIAGTPPTAPAAATPTIIATVTGAVTAPPSDPSPAASAASAESAQRDTRREAAALAGLNEQALAALIGELPDRDPADAALPAAPAPAPAAPAPVAQPPESADPESAPPPTFPRRRTTPPQEEPAPPAVSGVVE